jgi:hypothetical protein
VTSGRLLDLWEISDESFDVLRASLDISVDTQPSLERQPLLGDRFISDPDFVSTWYGVSIAPVDGLWLWVSQMMRGAGMYGWDRLEGPGRRSCGRLLDGIPRPSLGDRLAGLLEICALEEGVEIVWKNIRTLVFEEASITEFTLDYTVDELQPVGSRLIGRIRCRLTGATKPVVEHAARTLSCILPRCQVKTITEFAGIQHESGRPRLAARGGVFSFQRSKFVPAGER